MSAAADSSRRAGLLCAAVAFAVTLAWAFITPPLQVPDEPGHLAYVQQLAETGHPPTRGDRPPLSSELSAALDASQFSRVIGNPAGRPPWGGADAQRLTEALSRGLARDDGGGASAASGQPPAYYLLAAVPYKLARAMGGTLWDALQAARALSALLAALTVLAVFWFIRELLPSTRGAATAGALAVAFQPMFGFISSGVTVDALLFTVSAAMFAALARAFRRGLTVRRAVAIGALAALGVLTKVTFLALVPGVLVAMLVMLARLPRGSVVKPVAGFLATAALPVLAYLIVNRLVWNRGVWESGGDGQVQSGRATNLRGTLSYFFQFYLPRPPFLRDLIPGGGYPVFELWFRPLVGRFGWVDYGFPGWVTWFALAVWGMLLALVARALTVGRSAVRSRSWELATYALMTLGLLVVIAKPAYDYQVSTGFTFEQIRYLFPLLALYGAIVGLAVRGAGRFGAQVAAGIVSLAVLHSGFALLLTLGRYYV